MKYFSKILFLASLQSFTFAQNSSELVFNNEKFDQITKNSRPGTESLSVNYYNSFSKAERECPKDAEKLASNEKIRPVITNYSITKGNHLYFCNIAYRQYLSVHEDYIRALRYRSDFDFSRKEDVDYVVEYFKEEFEQFSNKFYPFKVSPISSNAGEYYANIKFEVSFPEDFVPDFITQKISTNSYDYGHVFTEKDALERLERHTQFLSSAYKKYQFEVVKTEIKKSKIGDPSGNICDGKVECWIYTEYLTYKVSF